MTQKEDRNWRINWTFDKILFGLLCFLALKTYSSVERAVESVGELKQGQALLEYRMNQIESRLKLSAEAYQSHEHPKQ